MRPLITDEDFTAASYAGFGDALRRWISFACKILAAWAPLTRSNLSGRPEEVVYS